MKLTRLVCCLLCLMLCFAACDKNTPEAATTAPTTEPIPTTAPTEPAPTPQELYAAAVEAQASLEGYTLTVSHDRTVTAGDETFTESADRILVVSPEGTVQVDSELHFGDEALYCVEIFAEDTAYLSLAETGFRSEMTREDFLSRYTPAVLLDAANYAAVDAQETGGGLDLTFAEATAVESWMGLPELNVTAAEGAARLDANGALVGSTYNITYGYSGVSITDSFSVSITSAGAAPAVPENAKEYIAIDSIDGPVQLERAYFHLNAADTVTGTSTQLIASQAAGYACDIRRSVDETQGMYRFQTNIYEQLSSGQSNSYTMDELFKDGVYTITEGDGKPQEQSGINEKLLSVYRQQVLEDSILPADYIAECTVTDLGSVLLLECTGNEAWGDEIRALTCGAFLTDPAALDNIATNIADLETSFYLAVDKYIGIPTAYGFTYECSHTIQGSLLTLKNQTNISYDVASLSAYENITEEPAPAGEAEAPTPLLYKVTGENGQQMWLFGTIHVGDDRTAYLPQALTDALLGSDALAVECDSDAFDKQLEKDKKLANRMAEALYYSDDTTVKDHITDSELYEQALKLMKASGSYGYTADTMKIFLWEQSIDHLYMGQGHQLCSEKGLESRLKKIAEDNDIPLREVESSIFQIEMMAGWSDALQESMLESIVATDAVEYNLELQELYDLWCAGDEAALIEMLQDDSEELEEDEVALYEEYNKSISTDRNAGMLDVAKKYLESGDVVFYAVGLAHLLAEDGLVFTLRDAGYTVELVTFN